MKRWWAAWVLALCVPFVSVAQESESEVFERWQAGAAVSLVDARIYGLEHCFGVEEISDEIYARMRGKSYKEGCRIALADLRYVRCLHHTPAGEIRLGELVCNRRIADDLVAIFRELFDQNYPIERMVLIDDYDASDRLSMEANNTSAFNYREIRNTGKLSNHSWGLAVDINPLYNPCVIRRRNGSLSVDPEKGRPYADRAKSFRMKIDRNDPAYKAFIARGFEWGGNWHSLKDYQHFEMKE